MDVSDLDRTPMAYVAVVGPSEPSPAVYELGVHAGRLLAERGAVVVCGGMGGVMEAAARGASEGGGMSLGILPGLDRSLANRYLTLAVASGVGELRNALIVRSSDAVLALGGSWGTMSEVALAVRAGVPVVAVHGWSVLEHDGTPAPGITTASGAAEAVAAVIAAAARRG